MMTARKQTNLLVKAALIGLILAAYWLFFPPYHEFWVGDDYVQLAYVRKFVSQPFTAYEMYHPTWISWYYRPTQNLWFLANRLLFGLQPTPFYALQLTLHGVVIALLYRITRQVKLSPLAAITATALFAIFGHHMDVVAWISAIAIVLMGIVSLLAISVWLDYLQQPTNGRLLLTVILCLLALTIHEETIILPPFLALLLLVWRGSRTGDRRLTGKKFSMLNARFSLLNSELAAFAFLAFTVVTYIIMQLVRPNATINLSDTSAGHWLAALSPPAIADFLANTLDRLIEVLPQGSLSGINGTIIGFSFLVILLLWFWEGRRVTRLSLTWAGLHLTFIYLTLWTQRPDFFAGRHLYLPWMGFVLGGGALLDQALAQQRAGRWARVGVMVALTAVLIGYASVTRDAQADWLAERKEDAAARAQLQELLPTIPPDMHVFGYRFPITTGFLRSVLHVWYDGIPYPPSPSGPFARLMKHGEATDDYFVIDYEDSRVYNLMPQLQQNRRTIFLWSRPVRKSTVGPAGNTTDAQQMDAAPLEVTGPPDDRRLALIAHPPAAPDTWQRFRYETRIPDGSALNFAWLNEPGVTYRVLIATDGETAMPFTATGTDGTAVWNDVSLPLETYWGKTAVIHFDVNFNGDGDPPNAYWATPQFAIEKQ